MMTVIETIPQIIPEIANHFARFEAPSAMS